ncbi:peptidase S8/S53 domain-containing protein [Chytridium lagenaria]|nr:peptidase S8/S53 domain-containing protein [Chytridium lagenaria]
MKKKMKMNIDAIELKGYAAEMSQEIADQVKMLPEVELVEQDSMGTFEAVQPSPLNWGLRRAIWGANFAGDGIDRDLVGHGTQTAGIAGSRSHGVSKQSRLIAVKISGSLTFQVSSLISGLTWISSQIATTPTRRAVVNMSLRVGISDAVDLAVNRVMSVNGESVALVASAGNDGGDACNYSPARVPLVVTVGAVDATDAAWSGSNTGGCVDVVAPGVNITTTTLNNAVTSVTGTSFSTAHITGILALHLSIQPFALHPRHDHLPQIPNPANLPSRVSPASPEWTRATLTPPPTCTDFSVCAQGYAPDPNCGNCVAAIQSWDGWCAGNDGAIGMKDVWGMRGPCVG